MRCARRHPGKSFRSLTGAVIVAALAISGCANVSRYEAGPVVAFGQPLEGTDEPLYFLIRIKGDVQGVAQASGVLLQLAPDTPAVALSALAPELVARYLPAFEPPPQWPEQWKARAREKTTFAGGGFHISFSNGRAEYVGICSHCAGKVERPVVGSGNTNTFYTLPLTAQQLFEVFGQPARLYKVNEVRY